MLVVAALAALGSLVFAGSIDPLTILAVLVLYVGYVMTDDERG